MLALGQLPMLHLSPCLQHCIFCMEQHLSCCQNREVAALACTRNTLPPVCCSTQPAWYERNSIVLFLSMGSVDRLVTTEPATYLHQIINNVDVLCRKAHVQGRRELQCIQMPTLLAHQVVDLVDIQRLAAGFESNVAHLWSANHLQFTNVVHLGLKIFCRLSQQMPPLTTVKVSTFRRLLMDMFFRPIEKLAVASNTNALSAGAVNRLCRAPHPQHTTHTLAAANSHHGSTPPMALSSKK